MVRSSLLAASLVLATLNTPASAQTFEFTRHDSVVYATVGGRALHLQLSVPTIASPTRLVPCVLWIHGGGWQGGSFTPTPAHAMRLVREAGFAVASVQYRLSSQAALFGGAPVVWPAQIEDVKGAVRWLRANAATYHLDPERFGAWGSSAGGHLSAVLGTSGEVAALEGVTGGHAGESSAIQAFADYFGPTDLLRMNSLVTTPPGSGLDHDAFNSPESRLVGWSQPGQGIGDIRAHLTDPTAPYPMLAARTISADPLAHLDAADPPAFIAHGDLDTTVPLGASRILDSAMTAVGVPHTFVTVPGAGHGSLGSATDAMVVRFFLDRLTPEAALDAPGVTAASRPRAWPTPARGDAQLALGARAAGGAIEILDVSGRVVRRLAADAAGAAQWDGRSEDRRELPAGLYLARSTRAGSPTLRVVRVQ